MVYKKVTNSFSFQVEGEHDQVKLQMCANSIALMARSLSFDSKFLSPFSINARRNNINAMGRYTLCNATS